MGETTRKAAGSSITLLGIVAAGAIVKMAASVLIPLTVAFFIMLVLYPVANWTAHRVDVYLYRLKSRFGREHKSEESGLAIAFSIIFVVVLFLFLTMGGYILIRGQVDLLLDKSDQIAMNVVQPIGDWMTEIGVFRETGAVADTAAAGPDSLACAVDTVTSVGTDSAGAVLLPADSVTAAAAQEESFQVGEYLGGMKRSILSVLPNAAGPIVSMVFTYIMIMFVTAFLLMGRRKLERSLLESLKEDRYRKVERILGKVESNTRKFLVTKTITSLATGALVAGVLSILYLDVQDALIWGGVYFVMNYIPFYGSLIAGLGATLYTMATAEGGLMSVWPVVPLLILVNVLVSNFLEPKLMGNELPIGPVTVLLIVLLWAWLWGPWGMLLAIPITVMLQVLLAEVRGEDYWLCILMKM